MEITTNDFFNWQKNKRLRVAFAIYYPAEDGLPAELEKFYIDFADISSPVVAVWRQTGLVNVHAISASDYQNSWGEFEKKCMDSRVDTIGWDGEKNRAAERLATATNRNEKRFWTSVLEALNFYQMDSRIY